MRFAQPATPEGRKAMDDAGSIAKVPPYGEMVAEFPARFLPSESMQVEVQYRYLPGVRMSDLNGVERAGILKELSLSVK